jgi:hypothetical protein|tara:strand:- start:170 stop:376 length:207 start_codon:yes stop_codon:yes gene_type:complete
MQNTDFKIGQLLVSVRTGKPALVMGSRLSKKKEYGSTHKRRKLYQLHEEGRVFWLHDVEVIAKYKILS